MSAEISADRPHTTTTESDRDTLRDVERRFLATGDGDLLSAYRSALVWRGVPLRRINGAVKRLRQQQRGRARKAKYAL